MPIKALPPETVCKICHVTFEGQVRPGKRLSNHIKAAHGLSAEQYTIDHILSGVRPVCKTCKNETRYVSFCFKQFCKEHAQEASKEGGQKGGRAEAWNKGQTKISDPRLALMSAKASGTGNPFHGRKHTLETKKKNADSKRLAFSTVIKRIKNRHCDIEILASEPDYETQNSPLSISCKVCETLDNASFFNLMRCWKCRTCFPNASAQQLEVYDFIRSITPPETDITVSDRSVISPLELDIWIPSRRVAIEYHGLYWHSGGRDETFDKYRHRQKYVTCKSAGIRLIQIFSDEWTNKRQACESILRHAVGCESIMINARDCSIEEVKVPVAKAFLEKFHMAGYTNCSRRFTLVHPFHGIVGIATTRRPIQKKHGNAIIELARLAFSPGIAVRGGTSKLLKAIERAHIDSHEGILSYAELRFSEGDSYAKSGFTRVDDALNNYWYTNGLIRFNRFAYRAQKPKTEKQVADEAGVRAVYGCGNAVYVKKWK